MTYTVPEVSATTPRWAFWWQRALRAARFFIISVPWWICSPPTAITRTEPKQEPATCRMFWATSMQKIPEETGRCLCQRRQHGHSGGEDFSRRRCCRKSRGRCPNACDKDRRRQHSGRLACDPAETGGPLCGGIPSDRRLPESGQVSGDLRRHQRYGSGGASGSAGRDRDIINCTGSEAKKILDITDDGASNLFETSVACIGASICQVGVRDSQKLLATLVAAAREWNFPEGTLPRIHISGCPSSCGTHQIGRIGFRGGMKKVDGKPGSAFVLYVNGKEGEPAQFGEQWVLFWKKRFHRSSKRWERRSQPAAKTLRPGTQRIRRDSKKSQLHIYKMK